MTFRLAYSVLMHPQTREAVNYIKDRGLTTNALKEPHPDVPLISQTLPGASIPVAVLPEAVVCAGTIFLDSAPAITQDPELVEWVGKAPTIIINLGSLFKYTPERATIMSEAIQKVLEKTIIQVLWKVSKGSDFGDEYALPLARYQQEDRVRIMNWVTIDTLPLLELSNVVASVHHGGSSSYNEALA
jgi:UDP:flavonoid glycosyltransferase YjiC (YdhE family)